MSASWPTSVASDSTLYVAVNELQNNLSGAINSAVTTIGLNSTTGFPSVGLVLIDNEVIKYGGVSGNNLTSCTRAFDGTTAAAHSSAAVVSFAFCAAHHNGLKDEIIAIETSLNLTASRALSTDTSGRVAVATTTLAELNFVAGLTSAVQTQLNAKAPTAGPTFTGTITTPLTGSRAMVTGASNELAVSAVTATELGYVAGVTSAIQTQLNAKVANPLTGNLAAGSNKITGLAAATANGDAVRYEQNIQRQAPVQATTSGFDSTSSTSFTNTSLSASITPTSSSSRIRISVYGICQVSAGNCSYTIARNSTNLGGSDGFAVVETTGKNLPLSMGYIDSPATTSAITYHVQFKVNSGANTGFFGNTNQTAVIILEEII